METLEQLAAKQPHHNIGVSCAPSRIAVVDLDYADAHQLRYVLDELGHTPLIVRSPRGFHLYYQAAGESCGSFKNHPDPAWRRISGDVKGRGGFVVAPPSAVPAGAYTFFNAAGWTDFSELPPIPKGHPAMVPFRKEETGSRVDLRAPAVASLRPPPKVETVGAGSRNYVLFQHVLFHLAPYNGRPRDQVELRARAIAHDAIRDGLIDVNDGHPFTEADVERAIAGPITYTVEGRNAYALSGGTRGRFREDVAALQGDANAYMLLSLLRVEHGSLRFKLATRAMAAANVLPGWSRARYVRAADRLLRSGRLKLVRRGGKRPGDASDYELA